MEVYSHNTTKNIKTQIMLMLMSITRKINNSNKTSFMVNNKVVTVQLCTMLHTISNTHKATVKIRHHLLKAMLVVDQSTTKANISTLPLVPLLATNGTLNSIHKILDLHGETIPRTKALLQIRDKCKSASKVEIFISKPMLHKQLLLAHNCHPHHHNHHNLLGETSLKVDQHHSSHSNPHQPHGRPPITLLLVKAAHQVLVRGRNKILKSKRMFSSRVSTEILKRLQSS